MLSAIEKTGELNSRSRFLDLALVIGYCSELFYDIPAYGIECRCMAWHPQVVKYFRATHPNSRRAAAVTSKCLVQLKNAPNFVYSGSDRSREELFECYMEPTKGPDNDLWNVNAALKAQKHKHRPLVKPNKHHYDITKFPIIQRAAGCFDSKNPLVDVSAADLRANFLGFI
jgi:hypothetical protein